MLPSFEVENFRTFSHLQIPHLGGVNLIVGRNNVGKTMLLEAVRLYASGGNPAAILDLLYDRDEVLPGRASEDERGDPHLRIATLFHGRALQFGEAGTVVLRTGSDDADSVRLEVRAFRRVRSEKESARFEYEPVVPGKLEDDLHVILAVTVFMGEKGRLFIPLDEMLRYPRHRWRLGVPTPGPAFVPARGVDSKTIARQWDAIALHEAEDRVSSCLRIVAPVGRITAVAHPARSGERMFLARMEGETEPVSLKSLGDGMVRIFQIALAMESAKNGKNDAFSSPNEPLLFPELRPTPSPGILLLDEVENGIHYSVLPDLWRFVFKAASLHGIQVFATTHSWDCVEAFQGIAAEEKEAKGTLIRLEKRNDRSDHKVVTYSEEELGSATRFGTEVR